MQKSGGCLPHIKDFLKIGFLAALVLPQAAAAQQFLKQDQLLAIFPGATINGKTARGIVWTQAYSTKKGDTKKGIIKGVFDGNPMASKWYVEGDKWCENWGDGHACWDVEQVDAKSMRLYENGKAKKNLWHIQ